MIQSAPVSSPSNPADQSAVTEQPVTEQPEVSWKRWAVRIIATVAAIASTATALSAVLAGSIVTAGIFATVTLVSTLFAIAAFSQHSASHSSPHGVAKKNKNSSYNASPRDISIQSENQTTVTSKIMHKHGYKVVDVPGDGDCFFHAALVSCPGWTTHTLRQQVYDEAKQWLREYEYNSGGLGKTYPCISEIKDWSSEKKELYHGDDSMYCHLKDFYENNTGITCLEAIRHDHTWTDSIIAPFVARALKRPVITVLDDGSQLKAFDAQGSVIHIADYNLKNLDFNALGNFVLIEFTGYKGGSTRDHFRGYQKT